jgi:hypothetical protein
MRVAKAFRGQFVQVWRFDIGGAITTEPLGPVVFTVHP